MYAGREVIERTLLGFEVMALIWITYTAICYPLTVLGRRLEKSARIAQVTDPSDAVSV